MDMYTAALIHALHPLDRPYAPQRSDEDAFYADYSGFELPHWLTALGAALVAALHARHQRPAATVEAAPDHNTQLA